MLTFLMDAQMRSYWELVADMDMRVIPLPVTVQELESSGLDAADGQYSDGWAKKQCTFYLDPPCKGELEITLEPLAGNNATTCYVDSDGTTASFVLTAGNEVISIPLNGIRKQVIHLMFSRGMKESPEGRWLYARVVACRFIMAS
jgi:hypothetical protein